MSESRRIAPTSRDHVAYVTRGLPHYRVPFIQALAAAGIGCDVFLAGHLRDGFIEPDATRTLGLGLTMLRRTMPMWRADVIRAVRRARSEFVLLEHGASLDFTWSLLLTRQLAGVPRILWTHGIERRELYTGRRSAGSLGRWWQLSLCDAILCYDQAMAERLRQRFPRKVIGFAPNSTDGAPILRTRKTLEREGRSMVRARNGLDREFYIVALGRLVHEKGFHRIPRILSLLRRKGLSVGAILIGRGPDEARIRQACNRAGVTEGGDIVFAGAVTTPAALAEWLYCADICVNPGCLGLSVVDCMFAGVPVVSVLPGPAGPYHGPEWNYLTQGTTGWLADRNTDEALASKAGGYLVLTASDRHQHEQSCIRYAETNLGIQRTADGLLDVMRRVRGGTQRARPAMKQ